MIQGLPLGPLPWVGARHRLEAGGDGTLGVVRLGDGVCVGTLELEPWPGGVFVRRLEIAPEHRGYGAGSEAAWLLLDAAVAGGARVVRAWAAPGLGLSAYFWMRMGLHPLFGEGPGGGISYERDLDGDRSASRSAAR